MKTGIDKGVGIVTFTVTEEMIAKLDGRIIHPVYSTFWLAYHSEVAARQAIEPFFEEHENAVGSAMQLEHLAMAAIGASLVVRAEVSSIEGNRIRCDVTAVSVETNTLLARGWQDQVVMEKERLLRKVAEATL